MLVRLTPPGNLAQALLEPPTDLGRTALVDASSGRDCSFDELRERVRDRGSDFHLPARSVVVLAGENSLEWVVTYLALVERGHVPLLVARNADRLASTWHASARIDVAGDEVDIERFDCATPVLHDDLALLMSTSGSTASPKLVRLSHRNLVANSVAIADYQRLTVFDRGITSLPLHYCFGLSVLHSHLIVGASVVVTDRSVVDPCFRATLRDARVTNLAGVPHTYELMECVGPDEFLGPDLRFLAQAGGRLAPDRVVAWADRARRADAEIFVMYGQTEATARMAYLPPSLVERRPESIGIAIPGGRLALEPLDEDDAVSGEGDIGELVYEGPNVMMGYAEEQADLAAGQTTERLRTGDLARFDGTDGVFEIVGRRSRFVKPFGIRIDLDEVERLLRNALPAGTVVGVTGDDDRIVAHAHGPASDIDLVASVRSLVAECTGLPSSRVVVRAEPPPRTASGKIDEAAMRSKAGDDVPVGVEPHDDDHRGRADLAALTALYASVLDRSGVRPDDTFVSLGGDSLSFVECSIRLERTLGHLPDGWHLRTIGELAASERRSGRLARIDTSVVLRALGICMVVATHMRVWHIPGGAHTLLAVAGYNFARFIAPIDPPGARLRAGLRSAARTAMPAVVWATVGFVVFGAYSVGTVALVNNYVGPASHAGDHWHFWFIEVFVHLIVLCALLLTIPAVGRLDRRITWAVPATLLVVALVLRMEWAHLDDWYNLRFRTHGIAWFFALGWLIQRSSTVWHRLLVSGVSVAVVPGFFRIADREWRILVLLLVLLWLPRLPIARFAIRPVGVLAAASLWIYVSHFTIWPLFRQVFVREAAYVFTLAAGVGVWFVAERLLSLLNTWRQGRPRLEINPPTFLRGSP